jgi:uncharacterized protein YjiK
MIQKHIAQIFLCIWFLIFLTGRACLMGAETTSLDPLFSQQAENIDQIYFNEPSGIVFHAKRGTLFVVGDEGDICEIQTDGTLVKQKRILNADFEGVTYIPLTGLLYVAVEGEEKILEIDPEDFRVIREFYIERMFKGHTLLKPGGNGIEAITFVPDPNHPEGGTFYLTNQSFDLEDQKDPSIIFEAEVPLTNSVTGNLTVKILRYFSMGVGDLSGLYYDQASEHLYVISAMMDTFFEITKTGKVLKTFPLPGKDQEGITLDEAGFVYIAQDSGGIMKFGWKHKRKILTK